LAGEEKEKKKLDKITLEKRELIQSIRERKI